MRATLAILCAVFVSTIVIAEEPISWNEGLRNGWSKSRQTGKLMVIFATSDQCHYCDLMKQNTLSDTTIMGRIQQSFVPVRLHVNRDRDVIKKLGIPAFPTVIIATPSGKVIDHNVGFQSPSEMLRFLKRNELRGSSAQAVAKR